MKVDEQKAALIDHFSVICPLTPADKLVMKAELHPEKVTKGRQYCTYGHVCNKMGFVTEGVFKVVRASPEGQWFIPYFITEGHFVVDLQSFSEGTASQEYIEALTNATVVTITKHSFQRLQQQVPNFREIISTLKEKALLEKHHLKSEMLIDDAATRYRKLVQRNPSIVQRVAQQHVAQFLGISQYTLSRIRGKR